MKNRLIENIQLFLENKNGIKKSWIRSSLVFLLAIVIVSIVIGLVSTYGPSGTNFNSSIELSKNLSTNANMCEIAKNLSISVFVICAFPYVFLFATWIIGINQVSKSKYFHLFLWIFAFIAVLLAIVTLIIFIRSTIFNLDSYFPNS